MRIRLENLCPSPVVGDISLDRLPLVLGRTPDCNICLPVSYISRRHCQFSRRRDEILVQDLESLNGTFVNGFRADLPLPLHDGDELRLGTIPFRVSFLTQQDSWKMEPTAPFEVSGR